jgi:hypothetical protein
MPYEVTFTKQVPMVDREQYINDCCIGGDVVVNQLLPAVRSRYEEIQTEQEDWGWFIWFSKGNVALAIDVFTDDPDKGEFRVHLTSRTRRWLRSTVIDTPELEELRTLVVSELEAWISGGVAIARLDSHYM